MWLCMKWRDMAHGCMMYTERAEMAAVLRGTSHVTTKQRCKYTTSVDIQNALQKASHSLRIACNKSAAQWVCLRAENRSAIKAINNETAILGGGDSSVVRAPDSWLKGRGFESLLERRENFLLQGRLSVLTLISVSVPPPCYHSST